MKPLKFLSFTLLIMLLTLNTNAQEVFYQHDTSVKVFNDQGLQKTLAWCGGFEKSQFTMGDLNNDGLQDLIVYDQWIGIRTFLNMGTTGNPKYVYAPKYALNFPPVFLYCVLADYNCDGVPDLFQQADISGELYGFGVYKGYYNAANELCFTFYKSLFYNNDTCPPVGLINAFNNPGDVPAIIDVDNDGDLDFLTFEIQGQTVYYYRNMQKEYGLPCDSIVIHLEDYCWGKMRQAYYETHILNAPCPEPCLALPKLSDTLGHKTTHCCNNICLFDYDMDGDYDYLDGNQSWTNMAFLLNGRVPNNPGGIDTFISQDTTWPSTNIPINLQNWPSAFNLDINQDGKKDILVAPNQNGENYKCILYYENQTSPGSPNWIFKSDTLLVDQSIDMGTASYPVLFDFNKDGKPDLFIGSDGLFQTTSGILQSRIAYYENTSTSGHPSFTLAANNFMLLDTSNFQGAAPAFGDIDHDGKADMLIGHTDGTISYYKNIALYDTVQPIWQLQQKVITDTSGNPINIFGRAAPAIFDVDTDGKQDLIVGGYSGYFYYYQNISTTPGVIKLRYVTNHLGNVRVDPNSGGNGGYSTPFIGKIDSTGKNYLLSGSYSGLIYQFDGITSGDANATYTIINDEYAYIDTFFNIYKNKGTTLAVYGNGLRSTLTIGDIAGDGSLEMLVGNLRGGLELYKLKIYNNEKVPNYLDPSSQITIYPNPAQNKIHLIWKDMQSTQLKITIQKMDGSLLYNTTTSTSTNGTTINTESFPSGIYICLIQDGINKYYNKFTVLN